MAKVSEYYESYWTDAGYMPTRPGPSRSLLNLFRLHVRANDCCLDVGCGDGGTAGVWLTENSADYLGLDISGNAVALAQQRGLKARQIKDAHQLGVPNDAFDVAVCSEVLEHLFDPADAARAMLEALRPSGRLIVTVPNALHWRDRLDMLAGRWSPRGDDRGESEPWRSPHIRFFSAKSLQALLRQVGFGRIEVGGSTQYPLIANFPWIHRLSRGRSPSRAYLSMVQRSPSLLANDLWAVAWKP